MSGSSEILVAPEPSEVNREAETGVRFKKILVVEDDADARALLEDFLGTLDYHVTLAVNGLEALKILEHFRDCDAVVCDIGMPRMPGDMFFRAVQVLRPELANRFVFMTGFHDDAKLEAFFRTTGAPVLWKPFALTDLMDALNSVEQ